MAEQKTKGALLASILAAAAVTLLFYGLASWLGRYGRLDIYMGTIYVFILSMIVAASLAPLVLKRLRGEK